jgi:peroxiredoxin Q/BCP
MAMTNRATRAGALGVCALAALMLGAGDEKKVDLKKGDKAPVFQAKDDQGKVWKSKDHVGKKILVVFFYSADLTGG